MRTMESISKYREQAMNAVQELCNIIVDEGSDANYWLCKYNDLKKAVEAEGYLIQNVGVGQLPLLTKGSK